MAISFQGSSIYVDGTEPAQGALYGFSSSTYYPYDSSNTGSSGYMLLSSVKYYVAGYSVKYYITRLKYYTDTPLSSLTFSIRCATDNTNATYQRGLVVSTSSSIATNYSSYQSRSDLVNVRFTSTTISVTWNGNIPAGYFYVYLGPGANDISGKYSTMYAAQQSLSDGTAGFRITASTVGKYTITYNANGGSGTTASQSVTAGESVKLQTNGFTAPSTRLYTTTLNGNSGNNGTPTYSANKFYRWRQDSATGTVYEAGASFTPTADTTFYAQWYTPTVLGTTTRDDISSDGYKVPFNANGGTCSASSLTAEDTTVYTFKEWNSKSDGSGYTYSSTATYIMTSSLTLYAIWDSSVTKGSITLPTPTNKTTSTLTITFDYQGGTGTPSSRDSTKTITKNFKGWATSTTATSGITGSYTPDSDVTLFAIWGTSTVSYSTINLPTPTKTGYKFVGWATSTDATSGATGSYTPDSDSVTTLYAIWEANGSIRIYVEDEYKMAMVYVYNGSKWVLALPYLYNGKWILLAG